MWLVDMATTYEHFWLPDFFFCFNTIHVKIKFGDFALFMSEKKLDFFIILESLPYFHVENLYIEHGNFFISTSVTVRSRVCVPTVNMLHIRKYCIRLLTFFVIFKHVK
jgi:hypothetical protein